MRNRGSISRKMIKEMFVGGGERSSRSPSRSQSPADGRLPQRRHEDVRSPLRSTAGRLNAAFEVGGDDDSDNER